MNVVITGGNRGIGLELTKIFVEKKASVTVIVRKASPELSSLGVKIIEGIDVTAPQNDQIVFDKLKDQKIDLLIKNAGLLIAQNIENFTQNEALQMLTVNAIAPLRLSLKLLPLMNNPSKLILITSRMGSMADNGSGGSYGYRMSKAALNAAGVSLSHDLAPYGVTVAMIHPGWVQTDMTGHTGHVSSKESASQISSRIEELTSKKNGIFLHANGEELTW